MSKKLTRRGLMKTGAVALGAATLGDFASIGSAYAQQAKSQVFFTKDLSPEGMKKLYAKINRNMKGKVAIKLHTGEPNGPNIIPASWVKEFITVVPDSTIVECNVLYGGPRANTESHREVLKINGWTFCPVDIMDAGGDINLPIAGGKYLKEVAVGKTLINYDSMLVLTHFKGHAIGGFGGSLKNISIGCASGKTGKPQIHASSKAPWLMGEEFMERMTEGGKAITDHFGKQIVYINVLRSMSVDCDCAGISAAKPTAPDIGILASTDILAIDQASIDIVYALPEKDRKDLVERIESRSGLRQLTYMKELGMGNDKYELITI